MKYLKNTSITIGFSIIIITGITVFLYQINNPELTQTEILLNAGIYYIPAIILGILLAAYGLKEQ